jgi:flagellar protein FlgJ
LIELNNNLTTTLTTNQIKLNDLKARLEALQKNEEGSGSSFKETIEAIKNGDIEKLKNLKSKVESSQATVSKEDEALKQVCNEFESLLLNQMLSSSLESTDIAGSGVGANIVKGMYIDGISRSSSGQFGLSSMLFEYLSKKS